MAEEGENIYETVEDGRVQLCRDKNDSLIHKRYSLLPTLKLEHLEMKVHLMEYTSLLTFNFWLLEARVVELTDYSKGNRYGLCTFA